MFEFLQQCQNNDGGWSYGRGTSWIEPTAFALLALRAAGRSDEAFTRGLEFLARTQREDGGWPPHPSVAQSTWVTAPALLAIGDHLPPPAFQKARAWLLAQSGRESGYIHRIRQWMLGVRSEVDVSHSGWPWYPGAAAWVAPTALTILALEKASRVQPDTEVRERIEAGRRFLLARACKDGGWNHGSTRALGYDSGSYPETTGLALLALHGVQGSGIENGIRRAERHLAVCSAAGARCWLELGLLAHGRTPAPAPEDLALRTSLDAALYVIVRTGKGPEAFLS
ncbi:MAG: prenyltransferase/squalene oxidase repeat-containing protein [Rhodospirillales bacterium]